MGNNEKNFTNYIKRNPAIKGKLEKELILPNKIINNLGNWKEFSQNEMFVDFETISDICEDFDSLPERYSFNIIYMIGIGWMEVNVWKHKTFICNTLDLQEENRIMNDF